MDIPTDSADGAVAVAEQALEKGEPLLAYNGLQEALARWPEHTRLRQLQALSLARSGDTARANEMLAALAAAGVDDAETLGLLARTHKDLALAARDGVVGISHLEAGFKLYEQAYRRSQQDKAASAAWYTGINAATMAVLRGDLGTARAIASEVRTLCAGIVVENESPGARYWREATLGEASLILGDAGATRMHYTRAMALSGRRFGDVSSTRRQALLLAKHLPALDLDVGALLRIPPVVIFSGHMIDRDDRPIPRFPATIEGAVRDLLRQRLTALQPVATYGSAACGSDILCLEVAREMGCETHIILPFPPAAFRGTSVDFAGADWGERFERALGTADSVTVTSDHYARGSAATFDYANLILTGMGRLRAQTLDAPLRAIAVRDPDDPSTPGGTTSNLSLWRAGGINVDEIGLSELRATKARPPAPLGEVPTHGDRQSVARHEMRAMLFADAVGYSKLSEDQIPGYIAGFLGAVGELSRRTSHPFEHVETSGDGLYMVFRNATDAALFALELSAVTNAFDRARWGLPPSFNIRVALHCGPVHCATDPITGSPMYTGPHTSRAARIEPITPPGQVYASSAFAAVASATNARLNLSYVGRMPLAKGYGNLGLYHVRAAG
jgi:class 3 adenylate cyclase